MGRPKNKAPARRPIVTVTAPAEPKEQAPAARAGGLPAALTLTVTPLRSGVGLEGRDALSVLELLAVARREIDELTAEQVQLARAERWRWHDIGQALGVTAQAAQQRFGRRVSR